MDLYKLPRFFVFRIVTFLEISDLISLGEVDLCFRNIIKVACSTEKLKEIWFKSVELESKSWIDFLILDFLNSKNDFGWTALHLASKNGKADHVKTLIEAGADLNTTNIYGYAALHSAVCLGKIDCIKVLIRAGADLNAKDNFGSTALHWAVAPYVNVDCVKALIEAGADINVKNSNGWTALNKARAYGTIDCVKVLIEADAEKI